MLSDPVNSSPDARDDAMNLAIYGPLAIGPRATNIAMKRAIKMQLSSEQNETTVLEMLPHLKTWIICATNISYLLPRIYDLPNMFSFVQYFTSPSCRAFSLNLAFLKGNSKSFFHAKYGYSQLPSQHHFGSLGIMWYITIITHQGPWSRVTSRKSCSDKKNEQTSTQIVI